MVNLIQLRLPSGVANAPDVGCTVCGVKADRSAQFSAKGAASAMPGVNRASTMRNCPAEERLVSSIMRCNAEA